MDTDYIVRVDGNKSTNNFYGAVARGKSIFNHHDLTKAETYEAFERRCNRFMKEYKKGEIGLLYTTYAQEADIDGLERFAAYVAQTSPGSKVIGMWLKKTGENGYTTDFSSDNLDVYTLCFGEYDNLEDFKKICMLYSKFELHENNVT